MYNRVDRTVNYNHFYKKGGLRRMYRDFSYETFADATYCYGGLYVRSIYEKNKGTIEVYSGENDFTIDHFPYDNKGN